MYNSITTDFYEKDNLEVRKENGIYITPYSIIKKCFENEDISKYKEILEPSFGTGQFIDVMTDLIKLKKVKLKLVLAVLNYMTNYTNWLKANITSKKILHYLIQIF